MSLNDAVSWPAGLSRREVLKRSGLLSAAVAAGPLAGLGAAPAMAQPRPSRGTATDNLFTQIGVRPMINGRGTYTIISGSESLPEVKQAMFEASEHYVQMDEMMAAVGAEIAQHMGAPSAIVTCGCEAAIALATVACTCGMDPERSQSMPYKKVRDQVIVPKYSRNPYDFGIRMSGMEIVEVETTDDLRGKMNERTAMIYVLSGPRAFKEPLSIKTVCTMAKEKGIPVFVDAAAEEPRVPNIHLAAGATLVGYSGGKCMRGPQAAGVLLGPKDLCEAAFWNAAPHHNWGRALKVGKEEAMGMLAAVRMWYRRDHEAEQRQWLAWDNHIADAVKGIPTVTTSVEMPGEDLSNRAPVLTIKWDATKVGITGTELAAKLDKGTPRIFLFGGTGRRPEQMESSIGVMPYMLQPGDAEVIATTLSGYMQNPGYYENPVVPTGAMAAMAGTWNVVIHYDRGTGHQKFVLEQNGAALIGEQKGEVFGATLAGHVEADQVALNSVMKVPGYHVPFHFTGEVKDGVYAGRVAMAEYGAATFKATKA